MRLNIAKPSKILEPYINRYWFIENILSEGEQYVQRIIPSGLTELTLYINAKPSIVAEKRSFEDNFILSGHQTDFYDLQICSNLSVFSIVFQPQGLMNFFNLPLAKLDNHNIPLKYLNKKLEQDILPQLLDARYFEKRVQIVESYFFDLLKENRNHFEFRRISHIANIIKKTHGKVSIDTLASEACLSRKQFERNFSEFIGSTPKQYLKTVRFQLSLFLKSQQNGLNMTDIAYDSGYYDQSHFINEFKSLTGMTPKQYFDTNNPFSDFFE